MNNYLKSTERIDIKNLDESSNQKGSTMKKKLLIMLIGIAIILFIIVCIIVILLILKPWKNKNNNEGKKEESNNFQNYKSEFFFNTKMGDLKRICINQKSYENMLIDGVKSEMNL